MKIFSLFLTSVLFLMLFAFSCFGQKLKAEEIIAKHLDSIGKTEARLPSKSRVMVGDATITYVTNGNRKIAGRIVLASVGAKNFLGMNINSLDYPQEKFSFDGKKAKVAYVKNGKRSILGNFVQANNQLLEESILGGVLSTSWGLLNLTDKSAKISSDGTKKINGKETYVLDYSKKGDIDIKLYFDKETFRHVRSEYKRVSSGGIGVTPDQSSSISETRYKVTEDFSDFKDESGLMIPHTYSIFYSTTGQVGTTEIKWDFNMIQFAFNQKLDEKTFDAEAN